MALYGIYGSHTVDNCSVNNRRVAEALVQFAQSDVSKIAGKYKINRVVAQFHSALEHTLLWAVDADDPHLIQQFCIDSGMASFNTIKIVPLITFNDGVIPMIKEIHSL